MADMVLLGDEAVAMGAVHAGLTAAYAYPGTPSTEIVEFLIRYKARHARPLATWATNEKTAYEEALGVSMAGRRALVAMKHVGLNVAADPFMNSALVAIHGGLVVVVADDPGMHSSQNEQDSRHFADFARVMCLEPANQQEAYAMTREAFDLSERFHVPVLVRLVTRLAHSRAVVETGDARPERPISKSGLPHAWILLPSNARRQWRGLLERQKDFLAYTESCPHNTLTLNPESRALGVITTGIARNYYVENLDDLADRPSHLHIGAYPVPVDKARSLLAHVKSVLLLEEGYPFVERMLRGIVPPAIPVFGKESGEVPPDGELTPDIVRAALKLPARPGMAVEGLVLPNRPPQLCAGCPHADTFEALTIALDGFAMPVVTSDIGCYTLGALPPYGAIESCVCMGASVSMAKGASDAGVRPAIGIIGDSTFLHSGVTPLMDAVASNADMTLVIVDNKTTAMTGGQPTILPSSRLKDVVKGVGVDPAHVHVLEAHHRHTPANAAILRKE
ncbi:MAG: indolepyruvate ferredoxin oxidoreductase, partial [Acidobacteria bacterium]|nr:indolepyruvate ferredoxin oxidoreductase [Acidobacteriota bacterium]